MHDIELTGTQPVKLHHRGYLAEAVQLFKITYPGASIETANDTPVIGRCEGCSALILEGDEYKLYADDVRICAACEE